ncbi:DUF1212-domain-containing protein [Roridomyces roridus]|uniref:DUF1212-domain-containing protein n=1 Tax=Roridomyces roridus TaxID=1738132 RepID=A0AAD7FW82_9AGAR|nr:DUF1212-domain-containing protein [Roridomyces roridus]
MGTRRRRTLSFKPPLPAVFLAMTMTLRELGSRRDSMMSSRTESTLASAHGCTPGKDKHGERAPHWRENAECYITHHAAQTSQRQDLILKLARVFMMLGAPSYRLEAQIQDVCSVLDVQAEMLYLPDSFFVSFTDNASGIGSGTAKLIRQTRTLNLGKLKAAYGIYSSIVHGERSVVELSNALDDLMFAAKQEYRQAWWKLALAGGMCSATICPVGFNGSFLDALISFPLGALLIGIQLLSAQNELYSNLFELSMATLFSFLSAFLASTHVFCYCAVASASIVLILPGFFVYTGALEIMSRNLISGSVRMGYVIVYALFLGFGLAMARRGSVDYTCTLSHNPDGPWWQRTFTFYWSGLKNFSPWRSRQMLLLILFSLVGFVPSHFAGIAVESQSYVGPAVGTLAVGVSASLYATFFSENAFVVMITGILYQLPAGMGNNGGLLSYASDTDSGSPTSLLAGFETGVQLIGVGVAMSIGLGIALLLVHPMSRGRGVVMS